MTLLSPSHLTRFALSALLIAALPAAHAQQQKQEAPKFGATTLTAGMHRIDAEVARTEAEREYGLMFREKMEPNHGMLFDFGGQAETVCMWMKDTLLPLSVAFIDNKGRIINIADMQPQTLDSHCNTPKHPVSYALEMNLGWFAHNGIKPGAHIGGVTEGSGKK